MMTPTPAEIRLMLARCGLSRAEAAAYLERADKTVGRWLNGSWPIAEGDWEKLVDLCARQDRAADEALALIREQTAELGPGTLTLRMARTEEDAERLGWPSIGAHIAVIRRVVERAPKRLKVVPVYPGEDVAVDMAAARRSAH